MKSDSDQVQTAKCVVNLPLDARSTVVKTIFSGLRVCVICLVDCHVNVVISYHILWLFSQNRSRSQRLVVSG